MLPVILRFKVLPALHKSLASSWLKKSKVVCSALKVSPFMYFSKVTDPRAPLVCPLVTTLRTVLSSEGVPPLGMTNLLYVVER